VRLSLIAAVARNGAIGRDNELLWKEPADQRHFVATTRGHAVIMGRRTWESLPPRFRPLPGRRNIVVTRSAGFDAPGAETVDSLDGALQRLSGEPLAFVIGGAQLYAQALPRVDEMVLTEIDADFDGDVYFPAWDRQLFVETAREVHVGANGTHFAFVSYRRRTP
jgi:dihydrofolate reductase